MFHFIVVCIVDQENNVNLPYKTIKLHHRFKGSLRSDCQDIWSLVSLCFSILLFSLIVKKIPRSLIMDVLLLFLFVFVFLFFVFGNISGLN